MKAYLVTLAATVLAGVIGVAGLLSHRYWVARDLSDVDVRISQLTKYQEQKLATLPPGAIDTVFLGDSSLGNAIDAERFDELFGTRSVNLALTGGHGHAAALVLLRRMAELQPKLRNVILFFAVDGMAWGTNPVGRFYMSPSPLEPALPPAGQWDLFRTYLVRLTDGREALSYLAKIFRGNTSVVLPPSIYIEDYTVSHARIRLDSKDVRAYRMPTTASDDSTYYLREMGRICQRQSWRCIYAQGTIMAQLLTGSATEAAFLAEAAAKIRAAGFALANERPLTISADERGDSIFHVAHEWRPEFTERYGKLIAPLLARPREGWNSASGPQ